MYSVWDNDGAREIVKLTETAVVGRRCRFGSQEFRLVMVVVVIVDFRIG